MKNEIVLVHSESKITNNSTCYDCDKKFSDEKFDYHHISNHIFKNYKGQQLSNKVDVLVTLKKTNKPWQNSIMVCDLCHKLRHKNLEL